MPTAAVQTYSNSRIQPCMDPQRARTVAYRFQPNLNVPAGALVGEVTATPGLFGPYDDTAVNGLAVAKGISEYGFQTDANGLVTFTSTASQVGDERNIQHTTAPVFVEGYFRTADLPQAGTGALDANGLNDLGRLVSGSLADGVLHVR